MSSKPDWFHYLVASMDMLDPLYRKVTIFFREEPHGDLLSLIVDSGEEVSKSWDERQQVVVLTSRLRLKVTYWGYPQTGTRQLLKRTLELKDVAMISIENADYDDDSTTDKRLWVRDFHGSWQQYHFPLVYDQWE